VHAGVQASRPSPADKSKCIAVHGLPFGRSHDSVTSPSKSRIPRSIVIDALPLQHLAENRPTSQIGAGFAKMANGLRPAPVSNLAGN